MKKQPALPATGGNSLLRDGTTTGAGDHSDDAGFRQAGYGFHGPMVLQTSVAVRP